MKQTLNVSPSLFQYITENDIQICSAIVENNVHKRTTNRRKVRCFDPSLRITKFPNFGRRNEIVLGFRFNLFMLISVLLAKMKNYKQRSNKRTDELLQISVTVA